MVLQYMISFLATTVILRRWINRIPSLFVVFFNTIYILFGLFKPQNKLDTIWNSYVHRCWILSVLFSIAFSASVIVQVIVTPFFHCSYSHVLHQWLDVSTLFVWISCVVILFWTRSSCVASHWTFLVFLGFFGYAERIELFHTSACVVW